MVLKVCLGCKIEKSIEEFHKNITRKDGRVPYCKKCRKETGALPKNRLKSQLQILGLKIKAFEHYGNRCVCCGEAEIGFLTLDHKNNDGAKQRKSFAGRGSGWPFYLWLKNNNYPNNLGLQPMCFNCNCGRQNNAGICPHALSPIDRLEQQLNTV